MNWQSQACGRLISSVGLAVERGWWASVAMLMVMGAAQAEVNPPAAPRMAMGLIVKLKDAQPRSVVRLKAASVPSDGFFRQRQRMADATRRKRVSFLVQRPTAFAANVIHPGHAISWDEANAQAQRLRADPDVEWVVVNEIVKRQSVPVPDPGYLRGNGNTSITELINWGVPASGAGQVWLQGLPGNGFREGVADFPEAWSFIDARSQPLSPVVVAVLDTGSLPHPDLDGRLLPGHDFVYQPLSSGDGDGVDNDPTDLGDWVSSSDKAAHPDVFDADCPVEPQSSWHGLSIAGMLVANTNNGQYGSGMLGQLNGPIGPAMLIPVRVAGKCGAEVSSIIEGMLWASGVSYQGAPALPAHPARIINLSFGNDGKCDSSSNAGALYLQTIATLKSNGVLVIASAGNEDVGGTKGTMPANCPGVLGVTGLNQDGYKARYANMISDGVAVASGDVDAAVPLPHLIDEGIYTLTNTGVTVPNLDPASGHGMAQKVGTSFAAPQAVGVAAMMLAINPNLSVQQLIDLIKSKSRPFPSGTVPMCNPTVPQANCSCTNTAPLTCGAGILDAPQAVAWAASTVGAGATSAPVIGSVTYFTPSRVAPTRTSSGGGGGGSIGWIELLGLAGFTVLAAAFGPRQAVQDRQAAKLLP